MSEAPFLRRGADAVELAVKATPRARRAELGGNVTDAAGAAWLVVKVTEPADQGRATLAVLRLVAARCGVAAGDVTLLSGATSRWKRLRVAGDPARIVACLAATSTG